MSTISKLSLLTLLGLGSLLSAIAADSAPAPAKDPNRVRIEVAKTGWSADQKLVLGIRIYAKPSESLELAGAPVKRILGPNEEPVTPPPFTLGKSHLIDFYTGRQINPEPRLPRQPFFGPLSLLTDLGRNEWIQMGVAFPKPPDPPLDRFGKPQPYKLTFFTSLDAEPVTFTVAIPQ